MSRISRELLLKAKIPLKLRLGTKTAKGVVSIGPRKVKLLEDKIIKKPDQTGKEIEYVRYIFLEDGVQKYYDTKLRGSDELPSYFVQRFADINEGDEVILEMKKRGIKNYIEITPIGHSSTVEMEEDDEDDQSGPDEGLDTVEIT